MAGLHKIKEKLYFTLILWTNQKHSQVHCVQQGEPYVRDFFQFEFRIATQQ